MLRRSAQPSAQSNVLSIRAPPHVELNIGYNGVRATHPRLRGILEVRAPAGVPIALVYITIALVAKESIAYTPPGRTGLAQAVGAGQRHTSSRILGGKETLLWQVPKGMSCADVLFMDIPFVLPLMDREATLETRLPASSSHPNRSTAYELVATLHAANTPAQRSSIDVVLDRYDTLPSWGQYHVPRALTPASSDHVVEMKLMLARTCYGPGETVVIDVELTGNPDWQEKSKKVRVDHLSLSVERVVRCRVDGFQEPLEKRKRVAKSRLDMSGERLGTSLQQRISCLLPGGYAQPPGYDQPSTSQTTLATSDGATAGPHACTTHAFLYDVEFELRIKAALKGAKDIVATTPVTISSFTSIEAETILKAIEQAVYEAYDDKPIEAGVDGQIDAQWASKRPPPRPDFPGASSSPGRVLME